MSGRPLLITAIGCLAIAGPMVVPPRTRILWNVTPSAPVGLYRVQAAEALRIGDRVAVLQPDPVARFLDRRGYLPLGLPLLKRIAAVKGQQVCRHGATVRIDGRPRAVALARDQHGRPMPRWSGCRRLLTGELFLLGERADSVDGRYFGPTSVGMVIGRATPLWIDAEAAR